MRNLQKLRAAAAGILCAGLLLVGIGIGVGFVELSHFTYAGHFTLDGMTSQSYSEVLTLEDHTSLYVSPYYTPYGTISISHNTPVQGVDVETDSSLPTGQVRVDVTYRSVYSEVHLNCYEIGNGTTDPAWRLNIYTTPKSSSPLPIFMAYKDRVLNDIRQHKLGDYDEVLLDRVVIAVNPADKNRILLERA